MAEEEVDSKAEAIALRHRFQDLTSELQRSSQSPIDASNSFCQDFCQILLNQGHQRKPDEDQLSVLEMYTVAIVCYAEASPFLCPECEHFTDVLDKLLWSCLNHLLNLSFFEQIPGALWKELQTSVTVAHGILQSRGNSQLNTLSAVVQENGVWSNITLCSLLSNNRPDVEKVHEFLAKEGPELLHMRIKHLIKQKLVEKAAMLAKACAEFQEFGGNKNFKQIYLVCLCEINSPQELMQEIKDVDCKDALDMICNLESDEDEKGALSLCTAFFKRQLLSGDVYCAWELTLFWSKLLIRLESKEAFLEQCRLLSRLSGSVYHILLLIKVVQAEVDRDGLSVCIEMCIQALKMGVHDSEDCNISICKTISCLLPSDVEVKRACQLTEFLIKPSVESYYLVEMVFNEPDQKLEEEDPSIINSLRCDLLLALKTKWPFDPEFWDWKTLKHHCISLMGQETAAILSADKLTDSEDNEAQDPDEKDFKDLTHSQNSEPSEVETKRKKKIEMKKLKERGFVSARFRNWQAYMQYCVLCDKEFLGHRIVKHALKHVQDGIFRCPICAKQFETGAVLEPHVASHVRESAKERLAAMNATKKRASLDIKLTPVSTTLNKPKHYNEAAAQLSQETTIWSTNVCASNCSPSINGKAQIKSSSPRQCSPNYDDNTKVRLCPVTSCQKVFKYFRNLVEHVKAHRDEQEAIHFLETQSQNCVTKMCQYCHRQFVNLTHLNDHLQMHCGEKPYCCIQLGCNCSFPSYDELLVHRKLHAEFQAQCTFPNCGRIFSETYLLYDHEAQHYMTFSCKRHNCDNVFSTLLELNLHQQEHAKQDHTAVDETLVSQIELPAQTYPALEFPPSLIKEVESLSESENVSQTSAIQADDSDTSRCLQSNLESTEQLGLESCYVKLNPIVIKGDDPLFGNTLKTSDSLTQTFLKDKKLFCFPVSQPECSTLNSSCFVTEAKIEKNLTHVCPFESCTRKYSTSKSLSRHVKKMHSEAFEEWKLSKKYKRIAEIAARKSSSERTTTSNTMKTCTSHSRQILQHGKEFEKTSLASVIPSSPVLSCHDNSMQTLSAKLFSQLEGTQGASPDQSALMQLPSQAWPTPGTDNMNKGLYVQNHYSSMSSSDSQHTNSLNNFDSILDYASACVDDNNTPLSVKVHSPSSVMNEASKYVSSSLRVLHALNGDQTFDLSQVESASADFGYSQIGLKHPDDISSSAGLLHAASLPGQNISPDFPAFPSEASPVSVQLMENKETSTSALFSSDIKCLSSLTPNSKEQSEDFTVSVGSTEQQTDEKHPEDFCNHELSQKGPEGPPSIEQIASNSVETKKAKKTKSSKRTKWPAIIQDGKVICCRCYREFSSTKSLGGHLSKRSQCKPVDEIDLTADLPASFLDFLNDPDISTVQMPLSTNNTEDQDHKSFICPLEESSVFIDNSLTIMDGTNCNIQNMCSPSQEPSKVLDNPTFCLPPVQEKDIKTKPEPDVTSASTVEDGKIVEIERALQRLDLVDILNWDTVVPESTDLHNQSSTTETRNDNCHIIRNEMENEQKFTLKPYRCKEDCPYGAMTKEALFKHLCRVHDYSEERINEMKKDPDKLAPYSCHICSKTFTRTTGLKIHYKNVHHFSKENISSLKIGLGCKKINLKKKSTVESQDVHLIPISKSGQYQYQVNPKLSMKSVERQEVSVATGKTSPMKEPPAGFSSKIYKTVKASQRSMANLDRLSGTNVKNLKDTSQTPETNDLNESGVRVRIPFPCGTVSATTKGETTQLNSKTETNSDEVAELQKKNDMQMDNIDSADPGNAFSLYRPYRCVHEGCVAAFSIQQNLILHYRAMHQSEHEEKTGAISEEADGSVRVQEYKCQVKQCSKVVSKVTSLLKHYLLLHRCTLEKTSALISGVEVGTFQCDQSKCSAHFTCHVKYIDHIKNDHKAIKVSAEGGFERVDLTFKCQFEGCDRVYTTKSNLLRHLVKKHHATFETRKEKQDNANEGSVQAKTLSASPDPNSGKGNIATNNKMKKSLIKTEDKAQNQWVTFAKPVLKSIDEASAMCNKTFPLQYPCMIKSCDSVLSAEENILKHYSTHGLTEGSIKDQRSQLIFCKKGKEMSDSTSDDCEMKETLLEAGQTENCRDISQNIGPGAQSVTDVLVNESITAITGVKRKRGRPRKLECKNKIYPERKKSLRNCSAVKCTMKGSGSILNHQGNYVESDVTQKLCGPLEYETSVLKYNEDSKIPAKPNTSLQPVIRESDEVQCIVNFRNPLKLETVKNVKIVIYRNMSTSSDLLKQLQDMEPLVILNKWLHS